MAPGAVCAAKVTALGERYHEHAYTDTSIYLGVSGEGEIVDETHPAQPLTTMTVDALCAAEHVWLQAISTYQVSEDVVLAGLVALVTPEGYVFTDSMSYVLMPAMAEHDVWAFPLDNLLNNYIDYGNGPAAGHYTVAYFFGDQPVSMLEFDLESEE